MHQYVRRQFLPLLFIFLLASCGGGGSDSSTTEPVVTPPTDTTPVVNPPTDNPTTPTTYSTVYHTSGSSKTAEDNGVTATGSGVQVFGKSTQDESISASGLTVATGGLAEVRVSKNSDGSVSNLALLLSNIGISWDKVNERPQIIETFNAAPGRTVLGSDGTISSLALPDSSDLSYYDYAILQKDATKANYANNRYFPRSAPSRCDAGNCPVNEIVDTQSLAGDWDSGGSTPDHTTVARLHEDGDVHAGNGKPDANGNATILEGGSGFGVPFPGSKGYRFYDNWSYLYSNLTAWFSQDTVDIAEWLTVAGVEHNQNRRGIVAFGAATDPSSIPSSGSATYSGFAYGWYTPSSTADALTFKGTALVTVNFSTRQVVVQIQNATESDGTAVPVTLTTTSTLGAAGSNANYLTGAVSTDAWSGGLSGRFFGPVASASTSGPAELGGAFTLSGKSGSAAVVAGFIAQKQ